MVTKDFLKEERDKIVLGLEESYRQLIQLKRQSKSPLIVVRKGIIVAIDPEEVSPTVKYKRENGK